MVTADSSSFSSGIECFPANVNRDAVAIFLRVRRSTLPHQRTYLPGREIEKQIAVVETLVAVGKSDALTGRLRELEKQKRALAQKVSSAVPFRLLPGAADRWRELVANLEPLNPTPDEMEIARQLLHDNIREVAITEDASGVFAYARLNSGAE